MSVQKVICSFLVVSQSLSAGLCFAQEVSADTPQTVPGASADDIMKRQNAMDAMIAQKNDTPVPAAIVPVAPSSAAIAVPVVTPIPAPAPVAPPPADPVVVQPAVNTVPEAPAPGLVLPQVMEAPVATPVPVSTQTPMGTGASANWDAPLQSFVDKAFESTPPEAEPPVVPGLTAEQVQDAAAAVAAAAITAAAWAQIEPSLPQSIKDAVKNGHLTMESVIEIFKQANEKWEKEKAAYFDPNDLTSKEMLIALNALGIKPEDAAKLTLTQLLVLMKDNFKKDDATAKKIIDAVFMFLFYTIKYEKGRYSPEGAVGDEGNCVAMSILLVLFTATAGVEMHFANTPPVKGMEKEGGHAFVEYTDKDGKIWFYDLTTGDMAISKEDLSNTVGLQTGLGWNRAEAWVLQWTAIMYAKDKLWFQAQTYLEQIGKVDPDFFKNNVNVQSLLKLVKLNIADQLRP